MHENLMNITAAEFITINLKTQNKFTYNCPLNIPIQQNNTLVPKPVVITLTQLDWREKNCNF